MTDVRELWRDLGRSGRAGVVAAGVALVLLVPVLLVGPIARSALAERAADRGLATEVESVRLGLRGVWLRGVVLASAEPVRVTANVDAVLVPFTGGPIEVHGGRATLRGSPSAVRDAVRSKRSGGASGGGSRRELTVRGVDVTWFERSERVTFPEYAWGVAFERTATNDRVRCDRALLGERGARVEVRGADVTLSAGAGPALRGGRVGGLDIALELGARAPAPAPKEPVTRASAPAPGASQPGLAGAVGAARGLATSLLADGAKLEVDALRVRLGYADEALGFGPSRVQLTRDAREVALAVRPAERLLAGSTPLALGVRLPLAGGEPSVELEGGPVALGALGVRDGDLGLRRVREASLEAHVRVDLLPGAEALRGSGSGKLLNVSLVRPELAKKEIRGLALSFRAAGEARLDGSRIALDDAELAVGDVRLATTFSVERDDAGIRLRSKGGVPLASCDAMLGSLPEELVAELDGLALEGTFTLAYELDFLANKPDATRVVLDVKNDCRVKSAPASLSPQRFRAAWVREVKSADGQSVMIRSGPGSPEWVAYDDISRFMEIAVLVCEDGGFYRHRGFDFRAIARAIEDDIRAGRFVRGASTISMQLAKNLYLGREKTLSRKIQEALLTLLLEQELTKKELMELYLNVVELAPGIYGVGPAASHYFATTPKELTLGQALYLASILPDPTRQHFMPDGAVTERWSEYLRKLMRIARRVERITDDELETGLAEQIGFRRGGALPTSELESGVSENAEALEAVEP
ncbi:MAG TPA: biosynthetic peptidoglycan transglycosylase [Polyangiaceae bacterium]